MLSCESLYRRDTYLNKNNELILNQPIIEYDLKSANTSLCRFYNLLSEKKIKEIENLPKHDRVVVIGKLQRNDREFKEKFNNAFKEMRRMFFEENQLDEEDILSVKKDAIFTFKRCKHTQFGDSCKFVKKNKYTSFIYLNRMIELYFNRGGICDNKPRVDVKGISDISLAKHEDYLLDFFAKLFTYLEDGDEKLLFKFISHFVSQYKHLQLPVGYYREFNNLSVIRVKDLDATFNDERFLPFADPQNHLDIDYNFANVIIPLINLILRYH